MGKKALDTETFTAMTDACLEAGRAVMEHGSVELRAAMRLLLLRLGQEVVRRDGTASRDAAHADPQSWRHPSEASLGCDPALRPPDRLN